MDTRQQLVYESIKNTLIALRNPAFRRPEIAGLRNRLDEASKVIGQLSQAQFTANMTTGVDGGEIAVLRRELRHRLLRISRHAVVALEGLPGIDDDMRVPHANAKLDELTAATARILKNLRPHLKTLHKTGLPRDAVKRLEETARALTAKAGNTDTAIARRSRATSSIPAAIRHARKIVRALDMAIKVEYANDIEALHAWSHGKRIPRKTGRPRKRRPAQA